MFDKLLCDCIIRKTNKQNVVVVDDLKIKKNYLLFKFQLHKWVNGQPACVTEAVCCTQSII